MDAVRNTMDKTTYKSAGVNIDAGMESLRRIKASARSTHNANVLAGLGGFGSLFDLAGILEGYRAPALVQSVDGVGTKLMVANMAGRYDTVGVDIVNHCCDDILCQGARPITFLDYIAVESLAPEQVEALVEGMARACRSAGVALMGGETAELPGIYMKGEFDLAGLVTGVVEKSEIIDGKAITPGDAILALASSGLHTNGYTLARKVFFDILGMTVDTVPPELGHSVGDELLEPHRNYTKPIFTAMSKHRIKGMAHITGGGLIDNIPRILPTSCDAVIERGSWTPPPVFQMIAKGGAVAREEMFRAFNMGLGMIVIVADDEAESVAGILSGEGETVYRVGEITRGDGVVRLT